MFNHPDVLHQLVADRHREAAHAVAQGRFARQRRQVQRAGRVVAVLLRVLHHRHLLSCFVRTCGSYRPERGPGKRNTSARR